MTAGRPPKYASATHVQVDGRRFIVGFDETGEAINIRQRKRLEPPMSGVYDAPYWYGRNHPLGSRPDTLPRRIIAAALEKKNAAAS